MHTYQHIIDRLNESQRIRLLTNFNSLSDPALTALGVPAVTVELLTSILDGGLPTPRAMALSWDRKLVTTVTAAACRQNAKARCLLVPGAKAAVGCVDDSLSEDPLLAADMASAILTGVSQAGLNACMDSYGTRRRDRRNAAMWASHPTVPLTPRVLDEQLNMPVLAALSEPCIGIVADGDIEVSDALRERTGVRILRRYVTDEETVKALARGEILMEGSAVSLQSAMHTYRRLQSDLMRGKATMDELNAAVAAGEAISEETALEALERLLSFADACLASHKGEEGETAADTAAVNKKAFAGMTVLLENMSGTLPLKKKTRFCLIGVPAEPCVKHPTLEELYQSNKCTCLGYAPGYEPALDRSDDLIEPAVELARQADVTVLFLSSHGYNRSDIDGLPANRIALFDSLSRLKKKLVVILDADRHPDLRFLNYAAIPPAALLLAPLRLTERHEGKLRTVGPVYTMETLFGKRLPSGRLTTTLVDPGDPAAVRGRLPDGPFLGYRYYDTVGSGARYAFGYGLSYTTFKYSKPVIGDKKLSFTITNRGTCTGVAVPQVYMGMERSAVLRPRKELVAYTKVKLEAGESKTVTLPIPPRPVPTPEGARYEAGTYTVYVGESVADIRLTQTVSFSGDTLPSDGLSPSDYLPTVSNIFTDHYTLEAEYTPMKASLRNPIFGIAALILAACVEIIGMTVDGKSIYPDVIAAVLAVGSIVFLIMEMVDRKRQFTREQKRLEEINNILFADARKIAAPTAEALFADTSDESDEETVDDTPAVYVASGEYDHFADVDDALRFSDAAEELRKLAYEKGVELDAATATAIFASFASTRLIVLKDMDPDSFRALLSVLCDYFGCPVCLDTVDSTYSSESAALLGDEEGAPERGLMNAIVTAQDHVRQIHIAALTDVVWADISNYFVPFAAYARAPYSACYLTVHDRHGRSMTYHLPKNLWFVLNLKSGETLADIPDYIADVATVHSWTVGATEPASSISNFRSFYYGQMLYLSERTKAAFIMEEDLWKKIDRLESFVRRYGDFRIGNKLWLGMETYLSVLMDAGTEVPAALDEALAVKLLPTVIHTLSGKIARDAQGLGEALDGFLGEDCTAQCRKTIKESGADIM